MVESNLAKQVRAVRVWGRVTLLLLVAGFSFITGMSAREMFG